MLGILTGKGGSGFDDFTNDEEVIASYAEQRRKAEEDDYTPSEREQLARARRRWSRR